MAHLLETDPNVTCQQWQEAMLSKEQEQQATGLITAQDLANGLFGKEVRGDVIGSNCASSKEGLGVYT